jgi:acyl carrier protein
MPFEQRADILVWIQSYIGSLLDIEPNQVVPDAELHEFGMDSLAGVTMISELEEWLGIELDQAAFSRCHTVNDVADLVVGSQGAPKAPVPAALAAEPHDL